MEKQIENKRFGSIDGLRMIACIGIVLMHIKANLNYSLPGNTITMVISEFTNFVFLFMVISSFGMCCGYFNKIKEGKILPTDFYPKRVKKILPFFLALIILDLILEHSVPSLIEGFADSTLLFGLLQKDIEVIGVGWFIGLVFIFYLIFPFFTYLFSNKRRAWLTTLVSILMNLSCIYYFNVGRTNMFYSFVFFCLGGLLYIYKDNIINFLKNKRIIGILAIIISIALYFIFPMENEYYLLIKTLLLSTSLITYAISFDSVILNNKVAHFIGNISFEIYLCHMVVFRILEKLNLTNIFSNQWLSYVFVCIFALIGSIVIATVFNKLYNLVEKRFAK